jgi:uncharacterized membrane protein
LASVSADVPYLAVGVSIKSLGWFVVVCIVLVGIGQYVGYAFKRRIGAIDPNTGRPGGSEKEIVSVIWFLAAIITGILMFL